MMMSSLRKGNARSCFGQWTDKGVGLSNGAVAGHIKRAGGLNARRVHKVNVGLVEKPVQGITHITCPYAFAQATITSRKACFLPAPGPDCLHA